MRGDIIFVAIDASKEINDYALRWALTNVTKAGDLLVLIALLPSPIQIQRHHSLASQFLSCLSNKFCMRRQSSFVHVGLVNQNKHHISHQIHKMQLLWLAHNLVQAGYEVKVVVDTQLASVVTKAKELKATWLILDRFMKKEADRCVKQLNCNVVLIDHAVPRILKAVNPLAREDFSKSGIHSKPAETDILNVIPNKFDIKSATSLSISDIESSNSGRNDSFSMSSTDKIYCCRMKSSTIISPNTCLHLNSEYLREDLKSLETFIPSPHKAAISALQQPIMSQVVKTLEGDLSFDGDSIYRSPKLVNKNVSARPIKPTNDDKKHSPNKRLASWLVDSDLNSPFKPLETSRHSGEKGNSWDSESHVSLDYETYLRESLSKFIQTWN